MGCWSAPSRRRALEARPPCLGVRGSGEVSWWAWPQRARLTAAFRSRSAEYPHPQVNTRSASVRSPLMAPHCGHSLLDGYQRSATTSSPPRQACFVAQQSGELGPAGIGDGPGQATVGQHPGHVQVLDDEPAVGLDQRVGYLMQEMPPHICDMIVVTPQLGCDVTAVMRSFLLT